MARISYVEEKDHPELASQIAKIKGVRGGLINIYKLLLHSPEIAASWFELILVPRTATSLTPIERPTELGAATNSSRRAQVSCASVSPYM